MKNKLRSIAWLSVFLLSSIGSVTTSAAAEERPRVEIFGAYSFLRNDLDPKGAAPSEFGPPIVTDPRQAELISLFSLSSRLEEMHGWSGSVLFNLTNRWGVVADFGGQYSPRARSETFTVSGARLSYSEMSGSSYSFLIGPRFAFHNSSRLTPFVQLLGGVSTLSRDVSGDMTFETHLFNPDTGQFEPYQARFTGLSFRNTGLTGSIGSGVDLRLSRRWSLRLVQVDYRIARHSLSPEISYVPEGAATPVLLKYQVPRFRLDNLRFSYGFVFKF